MTYKLEGCGDKNESVFWRNIIYNSKPTQQKNTESRKNNWSNRWGGKAQHININKLGNKKNPNIQ